MEKEILITDLETTGWSTTKNKIVEVGIVKLNIETGEKEILFDKVVKPEGLTFKEISESWIVENGYMSISEIDKAESLESNLVEIQSIINKYTLGITAFNNPFDFRFLEAAGIRLPKKLECPMKLSRGICAIQGKRGIKNPSVQEAWDFFFPNTNYIEKHRGADDAFHESDIVYELIKRGIFKV